MIIKDKHYLLNLNEFFIAPDGKQYKAVWGRCEPVHINHPTMGLGDNLHNTRQSANYFISVDGGKFIVAGCQVMYACQCDEEPYLETGAYLSNGVILARNCIYIPSMRLDDFVEITWRDESNKILDSLIPPQKLVDAYSEDNKTSESLNQ